MSERPLTMKQRKFIKAFQENGGNKTQAALAAYDTTDYNTAAVLANETLKSANVKREIDKIMDEEGLTERYLVQRTKYVLDADDPNAVARGVKLAGDLRGSWAPAEHKLEQTGEVVVKWADKKKLDEGDEA